MCYFMFINNNPITFYHNLATGVAFVTLTTTLP